MATLDRRMLLSGLLGAAGASLLVRPGRAQAPGPRTRATGLLESQVVATEPGVLYVSGRDGTPHTLHFASDSDVWKGRHQMDRPGDLATVLVAANPLGDLEVVELYANLVNCYGQLLSVDGNSFTVLPYAVVSGEFVTTPVRSVVCDHAGIRTQLTFEPGARAEMGRMARIIGCAQRDGRVQATRVWFFLKHRSIHPRRALL